LDNVSISIFITEIALDDTFILFKSYFKSSVCKKCIFFVLDVQSYAISAIFPLISLKLIFILFNGFILYFSRFVKSHIYFSFLYIFVFTHFLDFQLKQITHTGISVSVKGLSSNTVILCNLLFISSFCIKELLINVSGIIAIHGIFNNNNCSIAILYKSSSSLLLKYIATSLNIFLLFALLFHK